jgi:hypothetical protein
VVTPAQIAHVGVDCDVFTGLRVGQRDHTQPGQLLLEIIAHANRDHIVPSRHEPQRFFPARKGRCIRAIVGRIEEREIAEEENHCPVGQQTRSVIERSRQVSAPPCRLEGEEIANQAQHVAAPFLRRYHMLDVIAEDDEADAVVVADGGKRQNCGQLGGALGLESLARAELFRTREVNREQHGGSRSSTCFFM